MEAQQESIMAFRRHKIDLIPVHERTIEMDVSDVPQASVQHDNL
jgi:hypothetical protein